MHLVTDTTPRFEVSLSVIAVVRPEGYEQIPADIRAVLGGLTHAEHAASVDAALASDIEDRCEPAVVLFSAREIIAASREAYHFRNQHARELLNRVTYEEVLGGGVQIGYESVQSLLADTFAQDSTLESEVDPVAREVFADLSATFGTEGVEELHERGSALVDEVVAAASSAGLVTLALTWADHELEVRAAISTDSGAPVLSAPSEFFVATALMGVPHVTGRVELLQLASLDHSQLSAWTLSSGALTALSPTTA
jgi:hypothetical protein